MAKSEQKLVTPGSLALDIVLMVVCFIYFFEILKSHVPATDPKWICIGAAYTASCFTALFWLTLQMFRVVVRFQREEKKK